MAAEPVDEMMLRPPLGHSAMLMFGIFAAPFAWAVQLVASYALAASACFTRSVAAIGTPGNAAERLPLAVIAAGCALVAIAGLLVAMQERRSSDRAPAPHASRSRALAAVGILSSILFLGAIAFSIVVLSMAPQCTG